MPETSLLSSRSRLLLMLLAYLALLFFLTMMAPRFEVRQRLRLVPFQTIIAQTRSGGWPFLINIVGNVAAFVPLGILVPAWAQRLRSFGIILLVGLLTSITIELLQWLFTVRVVDIDDVLLNTAGALAGYTLWMYVTAQKAEAGQPS